MAVNKLELIRDLSNANGISGFEEEVAAVVKDYASESSDVFVDAMNNAYLNRKQNTGKRPIVMIDGHSDEVGFMVESINTKGLIKFIAMGGWAASNVAAHLVRIRNYRGEYIRGITTSKPPHFLSDAEKNAAPNIDNMFIDIGATSREEVTETFGIDVGCPVVPEVEFEYNETTKMMMGKAFDDRIGCACVIGVLDELKNRKVEIDVVGTISTQEEVGLRGSKVTSNKVKPDIAIVFEGTPADDGFRGTFEAQAALKFGPQVRHRDASMITHPRFLAFARSIAVEKGIAFQDAVRAGGGTDGGSIHLAHNGVPTIVIGIPVRYIHTHYGYCAYEDYEAAIQWGVAIIEKLNIQVIESL
ncbi:MAG: M20/M25/M40 family metallo-hydrolase [Clostridia bacterium]|nr:M20/M25/M40 family metallo-hydrolase [Clostridia bacterium]